MALNQQAAELERLRIACRINSSEVVAKAQEVSDTTAQLVIYTLENGAFGILKNPHRMSRRHACVEQDNTSSARAYRARR